MIAEFLIYVTSPVSYATWKLGALGDAVGLWSRSRRCKAAWADHQTRTKAAIERAVDVLDKRRTVAVLGSGLLNDIPIDLLADRFQKVILVDIVHLSVARWKVFRSRRSNISFMTRDFSGWERLEERRRIEIATGQEAIGGVLNPLVFLRRIDDLDLVISANVLSQIGIGLEARMASKTRYRAMPDDTVPMLIGAHLDALSSFACPTCLITDTRYTVRDRNGLVLEEKDLLHGVSAPAPETEWDWPVAPFGEEGPDRERVHRVISVQNHAIDLV